MISGLEFHHDSAATQKLDPLFVFPIVRRHSVFLENVFARRKQANTVSCRSRSDASEDGIAHRSRLETDRSDPLSIHPLSGLVESAAANRG